MSTKLGNTRGKSGMACGYLDTGGIASLEPATHSMPLVLVLEGGRRVMAPWQHGEGKRRGGRDKRCHN